MQPRNNILCCYVLLLLLAGTGEAFAQAAPATPAAAPAAAPAGDAAAKPPGAAEEAAKKVALPPSLFYTAEEVAKLNAALAEHERLQHVKETKAEDKANDYLNQLADAKPAPQPEEQVYVYPQFFLESLVYHAPEDWVVMVNGIRISAQLAPAGAEVSVLSVDKDKVLLEWKPKKMERVLEVWAKAKNDDILVDERVGKVIFTLHPNQTFTSYAMRVVEGKTRPVVLDLRANAGAAPAAPAPAADAKQEGDTTKAPENITTEDMKNDVGVKGLSKTYKRMGLE